MSSDDDTIFLISTHAPLARCDADQKVADEVEAISTHAPLARCDDGTLNPNSLEEISTHAPLARCDAFIFDAFIPARLFQLTHLLRGATAAFRHSSLQ